MALSETPESKSPNPIGFLDFLDSTRGVSRMS